MYSLLEENELIHQAQSGSQTACAKMLTAYEGLLKKMSRRYEYTPAGKIIAEDALSILYLAFMEAVRDFNPAHGTPFAAFLQSRLHGSIYKAFRQACRDSQLCPPVRTRIHLTITLTAASVSSQNRNVKS